MTAKRARFLRTCEALRITPWQFNLLGGVGAGLGLVAGLYLTDGGVLAALGFAAGGWFAAGYLLERAAAETLARVQSQLGVFISVFADRRSRAATMEDSLLAAAGAVTEEPLKGQAALAVRELRHHRAFRDVVRDLGHRLKRPVAVLWADIAAEGREGGNPVRALKLLDYLIHEDELITEELRGTVGGYMSMVMWAAVLIPASLLLERLADPPLWQAAVGPGRWFVAASAWALAYLMRGLRFYSGMEGDVVHLEF